MAWCELGGVRKFGMDMTIALNFVKKMVCETR